ncbi:YceI family protein [Plastoroseomonas arctica]|uniref:YceI family protein n=1 Tax=Plastoroseomonas arctica TaxID=1509237 RepID=A0AAF1JYB9_9PROT|nr:YceI family protein [Plastoroseomonas arctica]MBR0656807.1 YceI family protein [Plastoroseomonas arctica]
MARWLALAALLIAAAVPAHAQTALSEMPTGEYRIDPAHASVTWRVSHFGLSFYTARFTRIEATLTLDPARPAESRLTVAIDPLSVRTDFPGPPDFDAEIARGANFLNAGQNPRIGFVATRIEPTGDRNARIHGDLTLLGVTRPLVIEARFNGALREHPIERVPALGFSGRAVVARSAWGFTHLAPAIGDEVEVLIEAEFHQRARP